MKNTTHAAAICILFWSCAPGQTNTADATSKWGPPPHWSVNFDYASRSKNGYATPPREQMTFIEFEPQQCDFARPLPATTEEFCRNEKFDNDRSQWYSEDGTHCPAPPQTAAGEICRIIVLGRLTSTRKYAGCPGYIVLNSSGWNIDYNDRFISCVANLHFKDICPDQEILVAWSDQTIPSTVIARDGITNKDNPDYPYGPSGSITATELCQVQRAGWEFYFDRGFGRGRPPGKK